jgi:hypothetical protein
MNQLIKQICLTIILSHNTENDMAYNLIFFTMIYKHFSLKKDLLSEGARHTLQQTVITVITVKKLV